MTSHETLAAALAAMQAELPKLRKYEIAKVTGESKNGGKVSYSYGYAGLDQVVENVLPALGKNGLSITSKTVLDGSGTFVLEVSLLHEKGERETGYWPLPDPRRAGPQDIGSAMTYGRRYLTLALTGTFPGGEDDDGAKAQARSQQDQWETAQPRQDRPAAGAPQQEQQRPPKTSWTDEEVGEMHSRIEKLPLGQAVNGYDWMARHELHNRSIPLATGDGEPLTVTATDVLAFRLSDEAVRADVNFDALAEIQAYAEARGLLKVQVSASETLDQVIGTIRDQLKADATNTEHAQKVRDEAAASWNPEDGASAPDANRAASQTGGV